MKSSNASPKVSVIIPVYNTEDYLQACIDSLMGQVLENIECIFVNDASTDSSLEILERNYLLYPNKIRIINFETNRGPGAARNAALRAATAPYVAFVDSDDMLRPSMLSSLYYKITDAECDAAFCSVGYGKQDVTLLDNPLFTFIAPVKYTRIREVDGKQLTLDQHEELLFHTPYNFIAGLYRRSLIMDNNIFFPENRIYEDYPWFIVLLCYVNKITYVNKTMYVYRMRENSLCHTRNQSYHLDMARTNEELIDELKERGMLQLLRDGIECYAILRTQIISYSLREHFDKCPDDVLHHSAQFLNREFPKWRENKYIMQYCSQYMQNELLEDIEKLL